MGVPPLLVERNNRRARCRGIAEADISRTIPQIRDLLPLLAASVGRDGVDRLFREPTVATRASVFVVFIQRFLVFRPKRRLLYSRARKDGVQLGFHPLVEIWTASNSRSARPGTSIRSR
jgi:hypothetical protein